MDENLLARQSDAANVDLSKTRIIFMGVLNVLAALWLGYALEAVVANAGLSGGNIFTVIVGNVVFLSLFLLQLLFVKGMRIQVMLVLAETVALTLFFLPHWSWLMVLAVSLLFAFLLNAIRSGMKEMDNQMKVKFFLIERSLIPTTITALSLFISILYVSVNGIGTTFASKDTVRAILKPSEPLVQLLISKDFSVDMTVSEFASMAATQQLGSNFTSLAPAAKTQAVTEITNQFRQQAATYGVFFKNSDAVSDVFYAYFFRQFNAIPDQYKRYIPFLIFLLTFFTIRSLGGLMHWFIAFPAYVLFQLLLATGFARIGLESRSREIILVG